eukprot:gene8818-8997_t
MAAASTAANAGATAGALMADAGGAADRRLRSVALLVADPFTGLPGHIPLMLHQGSGGDHRLVLRMARCLGRCLGPLAARDPLGLTGGRVGGGAALSLRKLEKLADVDAAYALDELGKALSDRVRLRNPGGFFIRICQRLRASRRELPGGSGGVVRDAAERERERERERAMAAGLGERDRGEGLADREQQRGPGLPGMDLHRSSTGDWPDRDRDKDRDRTTAAASGAAVVVAGRDAVGGGLGPQGSGSGPGSPGPYGPGGWRTASLARSSRGGAAAADVQQAADGTASREDRDGRPGGTLEGALAAGSSAAGSPLAGPHMQTPPQWGGAGGGGSSSGRGAAGPSKGSRDAAGTGGLRDWDREQDREWDRDKDRDRPFDRPHFWPGPPMFRGGSPPHWGFGRDFGPGPYGPMGGTKPYDKGARESPPHRAREGRGAAGSRHSNRSRSPGYAASSAAAAAGQGSGSRHLEQLRGDWDGDKQRLLAVTAAGSSRHQDRADADQADRGWGGGDREMKGPEGGSHLALPPLPSEPPPGPIISDFLISDLDALDGRGPEEQDSLQPEPQQQRLGDPHPRAARNGTTRDREDCQDSDDFEIQPWDGSPISQDASPISPAGPLDGIGGITSGHASTAISPAKPAAGPPADERSFAAPALPRGEEYLLGLEGPSYPRAAGWDGDQRGADFDRRSRDRAREAPYNSSSRQPGDGPDDPRLYRSAAVPDRQQQYEQQRMFSDSSYHYGGGGGEGGRQAGGLPAGRARDVRDLGPPPYGSTDTRVGQELLYRDQPPPYRPARAAELTFNDYPPASGPSSRRLPYGGGSRESGEAGHDRLGSSSGIVAAGVPGGAAAGSLGHEVLAGGAGVGPGGAGGGVAAGVGSSAHSDLRIAVTDVIKDMLKPVWKSGKLSREVWDGAGRCWWLAGAEGAALYLNEARRAKIRTLVDGYVLKYGHL